MEEQEFLRQNTGLWQRKVLNGCWIGLGLFVLGQLASIPFLEGNTPLQFMRNYIFPSVGIISVILGICEAAIRLTFPKTEYILLTGFSLSAGVIVWYQYAVHTILIVLLIPVLVSLVFFARWLTWYTLVLCEAVWSTVYLLSPHWRDELLPFDLLAFPMILIAVTVILLQVLKRGMQIIRFLREAFASNRILKAENVVMDRKTKLDGLTGLYNHVTFHDFLDNLLVYTQQLPAAPVLAIIDIDNFKKVNDTFGHHAGDAVLRTVADVIRQVLSPHDFASRYGGEEFAILLMEKDMKAAIHTVEQIRQTISDTGLPEIGNQPVTVSIGLEPLRPDYTKSEWFQAADGMLYEAKRSGKNKVVYDDANKGSRKAE